MVIAEDRISEPQLKLLDSLAHLFETRTYLVLVHVCVLPLLGEEGG